MPEPVNVKVRRVYRATKRQITYAAHRGYFRPPSVKGAVMLRTAQIMKMKVSDVKLILAQNPEQDGQ